MNSIEKVKTVEEVLTTFKNHGFKTFSGVPDSEFKKLIPLLVSDPEVRYIPSVREDFAIATAAGATLAGEKCVIFMENSGLGNSCDVLTSLISVYKIPVLLFIAWAGYEGKDVPHHNVMGLAMCQILDSIGIPYITMQEENLNFKEIIVKAESYLSRNETVAILLTPGVNL